MYALYIRGDQTSGASHRQHNFYEKAELPLTKMRM